MSKKGTSPSDPSIVIVDACEHAHVDMVISYVGNVTLGP
jgi:hypothetical protein